jgi:hypothetical protein
MVDSDNDANQNNSNTNQKPVIIATITPQQQIQGLALTCDASASYDPDPINPDDHQLTYLWEFNYQNDTSHEPVTTYTYETEGDYEIQLTITDEQGASNTTTFDVVIQAQPQGNYPPAKPTINGPNTGKINTTYTFSFTSSDADNDTIRFEIDWNDGTTTTTSFHNNTETQKQNHTYTASGVYQITVSAYDNATHSETTTHALLINAIPVETIGYLLDMDNDTIYDVFRTTDNTIETKPYHQGNNQYHIDTNGDTDWDYVFNSSSNQLTAYRTKNTDDSNNSVPILIIVLIIAIILIFIYLYLSESKKKS